MSACVNDTDGDGNCAACARNPDASCRRSVNIEAILIGLFSIKHTPEGAAHAAKEVMRQHAHELAEKQRRHDEAEPIDYRETQAWRDGYSDGIQEAADLIDPEVLNSGGEEAVRPS